MAVLTARWMLLQASKLQQQIDDGIRRHAIVDHEKYGKIYAYEVPTCAQLQTISVVIVFDTSINRWMDLVTTT